MNEIKKMMENLDRHMECSTARGRARMNGRAIILEPDRTESVYQARTRSDMYLSTAKELAHGIGMNRSGVSDDELERVEFIREQLFDLAKDVCIRMIEQEAKE